MMRRHLLCCTLLTVSVMACPIPAAIAQETNVRTQIEAVNAAFEAAAKKGDGATLATLYTADAQLFAPFTQLLKGSNAIAAAFANPMNIDLTTLEVEDMGDTAYEVGTFTIAGADGETADEGKYVVIWKREDGQWKLHRDIWNSNMPPPSAASRADVGETVGLAIYSVKPEKKDDFERFAKEVLIPAGNQVEPETSHLVRFWKPAPEQPDFPTVTPGGEGLPYAFVFDPYVDGGDYSIESILVKIHGKEKAAQYTQDFRTYVYGAAYTHFTQE